ncbi:MAG: hypothetical protein WKF89_13480 [Chitinophagaceae bacterium]
MRQLQQTVQNVFLQLSSTLSLLSDEQYRHPGKVLFNATIGNHTRHIIEMFICLEDGYTSGVVNYENRKRDVLIETDKEFACSQLKKIHASLNKPNKPLVLHANYNEDSNELVEFQTNYNREIAYNLEHTIHHMALIKVGICELSDIAIPEGFGVASSTLKFRKECAQ